MEAADSESPKTISEAWINAQRFFEEKTGGAKLPDGRSKSLDDVIKLLEQRYSESGAKDDQLKQRTKAVCWNVLNGIKIVAKYAEPIVGAVYQPAGWCLEAASLLLAIPGKIKDVFGGFAKLFESIQFFLVRFKILDRTDRESHLPRELVDNTNLMLISFVRMCALCYKPLAGGKLVKMKIALGAALLNEDQGIHNELDNFDKLTSQQNGITHAVTLEHVLRVENLIDQGFKKTDGLIHQGFERADKRLSSIGDIIQASREEQSNIGDGVRLLVSDNDTRKQGDKTVSVLKEVAERLGSGIVEISSKQDKAIQEHVKSSMLNSASWLYGEGLVPNSYREWLDLEVEGHPLLCFSGRQNSGKSFVLAHILSKLNEKVADGSRLAVAYYAFPKPDFKENTQTSTAKEDPIITALKSLAYQIALKTQVYAQELKDFKSGKGDTKTPLVSPQSTYKECWDSLRLSQAKIDLACVFLIDDIDQVPLESRDRFIDLLSDQRLNADTRQIYVRSVVTGSVESFQESKFTLDTVDISDFNESDILAFISQELLSDNIISDWAKDHQLMLEKFQKGPIVHERDFSIIRSRIARIKSAIEDLRLEDEVQEIMDSELSREHNQVAKEIIEDLNSNLKSSDIKELNEILAWLYYTGDWIPVGALQELLEAQGFAEAKYLRRKLVEKRRYARLLKLESGQVEFRSSELRASLVDLEERGPSDTDNGNQGESIVSLEITIKNAPISHVRHFVWDLSKKLNLDVDFFAQAKDNTLSKESIQLKTVDAHSKILRQSLDFLVEPPEDESRQITRYVSCSLAYSLIDALKLETEHGWRIPNRPEIVANLMTLLIDVHITVQHWKDSPYPRVDWLDSSEAVRALDGWLRGENGTPFDPMDSLRPADRRRLKILVESSARFRYFHKLTIAIGKEWLQNDSWSVSSAFDWVNGYIGMLKREEAIDLEAEKAAERSSAQVATAPSPPSLADETTDEKIANVKAGSEAEINAELEANENACETTMVEAAVDSPDSNEMKAEAEPELDDKGKIDRAVEWIKRELKLDTLGSSSLRRVAETYAIHGFYSDAIKIYLEAIQLGKEVIRTRRFLAYSYAHNEQVREAIDQFRLVFQSYEDSSDSAPKNDDELKKDRKNYARWHNFLYGLSTYERLSLSLPHYHECTQTSMKDGSTADTVLYLEYINAIWRTKNEEHTALFLERLKEGYDNTHESPSSPLLTTIFKEEDWIRIGNLVERLIPLARKLDIVKLLAGSLSVALADTKEVDLTKRMYLRLYMSMASVSLDGSQKNREECARNLTGYSARLAASGSDLGSEVHLKMIEFCNGLLYNLTKEDSAHSDYYVRQMELLAKQIKASSLRFDSCKATCHLAWYYTQHNQSDSARELLLNCVKNAFDLLSDDDEENDEWAYSWLSEVLIRVGDDADAYVAKCLEMYGPGSTKGSAATLTSAPGDENVTEGISDVPRVDSATNAAAAAATEVEAEAEATNPSNAFEEASSGGSPADNTPTEKASSVVSTETPTKVDPEDIVSLVSGTCDGDCQRHQVTWLMQVWICRCCIVWFCDECLSKVRAGTLERLICHSAHEFFPVPVYDPHYRERVPAGYIESGARLDPKTGLWDLTGCEIIPLDRWFDRIRKDWGIKEQSKETDAEAT